MTLTSSVTRFIFCLICSTLEPMSSDFRLSSHHYISSGSTCICSVPYISVARAQTDAPHKISGFEVMLLANLLTSHYNVKEKIQILIFFLEYNSFCCLLVGLSRASSRLLFKNMLSAPALVVVGILSPVAAYTCVSGIVKVSERLRF